MLQDWGRWQEQVKPEKGFGLHLIPQGEDNNHQMWTLDPRYQRPPQTSEGVLAQGSSKVPVSTKRFNKLCWVYSFYTCIDEMSAIVSNISDIPG
jgi:hypothetical protein